MSTTMKDTAVITWGLLLKELSLSQGTFVPLIQFEKYKIVCK